MPNMIWEINVAFPGTMCLCSSTHGIGMLAPMCWFMFIMMDGEERDGESIQTKSTLKFSLSSRRSLSVWHYIFVPQVPCMTLNTSPWMPDAKTIQPEINTMILFFHKQGPGSNPHPSSLQASSTPGSKPNSTHSQSLNGDRCTLISTEQKKNKIYPFVNNILYYRPSIECHCNFFFFVLKWIWPWN